MSTSLNRLKDFWRQSSRANIAFVATLMVAQILIHLPMINLSPRGMHVWRQVVGHAAVQNYATEDNRFWYPRADIRMTEDDRGEIYHELPLTYWLAGEATREGLMPMNAASHLMQLLFNLLMIPGAFYTFLALSKNRDRSALFTFLLSFSPLYLYYAPLFEPNLLGLSLFLAGTALFLPRVEQARYAGGFALGIALLTLGTLAKPTYLFFGLPLAAFAFVHFFKQRSLRAALSLIAGGGFILVSNVLVLRHAKALYESSHWQRQFHTPIGPAPIPESWSVIWENVSRAATTWFLEMNINLAALPLLLLSLFVFYKTRKSKMTDGKTHYFWWAWLVSLLIFCAVFVGRLRDHDYYIASSLPLAALLTSRGAEYWIRSKRYLPVLGLILLVAVPYIGITRAYGRWYGHTLVPQALLDHGTQISAGIPKNELVFVDGDKTPIVFLYYLQRKGLSLLQVDGTLTDGELKPFKWLIRWNGSKNFSPIVDRLDMVEVSRLDDFTVFKVEGIKAANQ